jgi:hypothetical protein
MNLKKSLNKMIECTDYDSMGNHGRFPKPKTEETQNMKRLIQKIMLWYYYRFPKKKRKNIWDL